jgi:hypothetical protein
MSTRRGRPRGPAHDLVPALLARHPWLAAAELAALAGLAPRRAREVLLAGVAAGSILRCRATAAPWPPTGLYALARPDGLLPAPHRLLRLEHTHLLHALLATVAAPAAPDGPATPWTAALRGEPDGPPPAAAPHPLAGLADGWLACAEPAMGLLARWDGGEGRDSAERRWLDALLDLGRHAPPVAVVCADAATWQEWPQRLAGRAGRPRLRLCLAADLAAGAPDWRDEWGRAAGPPVPAAGRAGWLTGWADPPARLTAADLRRRLDLTPAALATLRAAALRPLLTAEQAAELLGLARRTAQAALAELVAVGLADAAGPPPGRRASAAGPGRGYHATAAGLRLLAGLAGEPPAAYRARARVVGGRLATPARPAGNRRLGGLALAPAHTRGVIDLEICFRRAAAAAGVGLTWRGPACPPVPYPDPPPALRLARLAGAPRGWLHPDARARFLVGDRRLTFWLEYERGTRRAARLAAKLRHVVGWGASARARDAGLLVVLPGGGRVDREATVHRLVGALAARHGCPRPPLLTTTLDRLRPDRALDAIWWDGRERDGRAVRRPLLS